MSEVRGIGIGVPGPVDFAGGQVVRPPVMPGWHGVAIKDRFGEGFGGAPVLVDNDVDIVALGEPGRTGELRPFSLFVRLDGDRVGVIAGGRRPSRGAGRRPATSGTSGSG